MLIVYDTFTGNVKDFVNKLPYKCCHLSEYDGTNPFILVTYTIGFGEVPDTTKGFLMKHSGNMKAIASSGNRNWGGNFANAATLISNKYKVPIILKFELKGTDTDIQNFIEGVKKCQNGFP
jgi:protein involved in ribonucleotide reduction